MDDLISFDDDDTNASSTGAFTPLRTASVKSLKPTHRDSFSDLAELMKAKKPYSPVSRPATKMRLSLATPGLWRIYELGKVY